MASESSSDCQDEKAALVETSSEQDAGMQQQCVKRGQSKLTLYHWTQSFNSQKVRGFTFQHHGVVDSCPRSSCIVSIATKNNSAVSSRKIHQYKCSFIIIGRDSKHCIKIILYLLITTPRDCCC